LPLPLGLLLPLVRDEVWADVPDVLTSQHGAWDGRHRAYGRYAGALVGLRESSAVARAVSARRRQ